MNFIKKIAASSALCLGVVTPMSNLYAAEKIDIKETIMQYGFLNNINYAITTEDNFQPELRLYQETRNSVVYLIMSVNDTSMHASVNGSQDGIVQDDFYHFAYKVTKAGWYDVEVWGANGKRKKDSIYIKLAESDSTINLSKEYRDGNCYLTMDIKDSDGIKKVTVNDVTIPYSTSGGKETYRVYNSGTYTVTVTDNYDNRRSASLYINVNDNPPTLTLSKKYENGRWYLVINANADNKISKVTVNGEKISFQSNGGTEKFEIRSTGTYKVVVTDQSGYTKTDSLYVDTTAKGNTAPEVKVEQNYKANGEKGWYLIIKASDDGRIASVKVNDTSVNYDASKGYALYYVPVDGNYTVVVTDDEGNSTTKTTYAAGNMGVNAYDVATDDLVTQGNTKVVFKLNSKSWTQNGIAQEKMSVAPKVINSRTYLPIRYVAYAIGVNPASISWDASAKTVVIREGSDTIKLKIGSKTMEVNGVSQSMEAAPRMVGGRAMIPISQIKSAFSNKNIQLNWDNSSKELTIIR